MQSLLHAEAPAAARPGRVRAAWRAAHEPVAGVSRRTRLAAYAVPFTVLPAGIWRLAVAFDDEIGLGERAYVVFLSVLSEILAFTAIGLVARWGEVFPCWVPFLRGRRVPARSAVVLAAIGAAVLTLLWTVLFPATQIMDVTLRGDDLPDTFPSQAGGWEAAWFYLCYAPLILWGPLLAMLTVAYGRRRRLAEVVPAVA
ncbi:hypothetical protein [Streptomyces sp. SBT349]|uniref:hypothetical protein n=1 Tax=Streptomyces sp. SBT349 TaxID=1580539 RepID=UPI00066A5EA9|nr:hypothetical protein [Streptomyces sp. SBT349]